VLMAWTDVGSASPRKITAVPGTVGGFPAGMVMSEFASLRWSDDGRRILLGVKEQEPEFVAPAGAQANVDVWHWKDPDPQTVQIVRVNQDRRSTFPAIYDIASNSVRQVGDSAMRQVTPTGDLKWGIGRNDTPYRGQIAWGGSSADYYRVDMTTGAATLIEKNLSRTMGISPDNKWYLYLKDGKVFTYNIAAGTKHQIDGGRNFVDLQDDHDYEKPVYGVGGWSADGKSVLMYDRYDIWQLPVPSGTPVNLTKGEGAKQDVRFRIQSLAAGGGGRGGRGGGGGRGGAGSEGIDLTQPLTLSAYGEWTKKSGYFNLEPGKAPAPLIWADKAIGSPQAAKNADRVSSPVS